ncbi:hypothetical protein INR49_032709 [Caranx melampygus]|nr:hypothetical protein INR49_032709 [Caranx melampygus]
MAYSRLLLLLLLLIGVISSHLPEVQGSPCHFWCNHIARDSMVSATGLKTDNFQQKFEEVLVDFHRFQEAIQAARKNSTQQCQRPLENLEHGVQNYIRIVQRQQSQTATVAPSPSAPAAPRFSSQTNKLSEVEINYKLLIKGKFNLFANEVCARQYCRTQLAHGKRGGLHCCA